jgi:tRNA-specific 2-thiouridylase
VPVKNRYDIKLLPATFSPWSPAQPGDRQVAVLMSGGVDSSVTAHLLRSAGWEVLGITMKIPVACNTSGRGCCGADAAFVCGELNIPHYFIDVTEAFEDLIIHRFRDAYATARTPNPCVDCNTFLKFSLIWDHLTKEFGITRLATGHYARIAQSPDGTSMHRAADRDKDQSYFLYGIKRRRLPGLMLPLGDLTKQQVRAIAAEQKLPVADKPESMELCFAAEQDYRLALDNEQMHRPGDLIDMQGNRIGEHKGIANYTIGQRRGLGFAGGKPLYVSRIDAAANTVALGTKDEVSTPIVRAAEVNALLPEQLTVGARLFGKIRSYGQARPCRVVELTPDCMTVKFETPQFAPCPGQRLVLYDETQAVVAGGTILIDN